MAKKKASKPETKTAFLRRVLKRNPDLEYQQVLRRWEKAGHEGAFSSALYYQVRGELGIRSQWGWYPASGPRPGIPRGTVPAEVYQFKITLMESDPPIWRRIATGDCTLDQLHEHIQTSMGWTNSHLHHFLIDGVRYGDPMLMAETFEELGYRNSMTTRLSEVLPRSGERFRFEYEYDFGDSWMHEVLFEGRYPPEPGKRYPLCIEGARACPPEDVGSIWGYAEFLEAIADPEHEQHDQMRNWIGGEFYPEAFSPEVATRMMREGLPDDWRREL